MNLLNSLTQEDAAAIALMAFGENDNVRIKHDAPYYIEIWSRRNYTMLQIQDNGQMCLMVDGEYQPIPNCFGIVKYLIEKGYALFPTAETSHK
jgi:hypothetical protein